MNHNEHLEGKVGTGKTFSRKKALTVSMAVLVLGVGLITTGVYMNQNIISASTDVASTLTCSANTSYSKIDISEAEKATYGAGAVKYEGYTMDGTHRRFDLIVGLKELTQADPGGNVEITFAISMDRNDGNGGYQGNSESIYIIYSDSGKSNIASPDLKLKYGESNGFITQNKVYTVTTTKQFSDYATANMKIGLFGSHYDACMVNLIDFKSAIESQRATAVTTTPATPEGPYSFTFAPGWQMVPGSKLYGYDMTAFDEAGLLIYSYNDPKFPSTSWIIRNAANFYPIPPLGYYVYNASPSAVTVTMKPIASTPDTSSNIFGRGYHILYWQGDIVTKDDLFKSIVLTYADGSTQTAYEAVQADKHMASLSAYVTVSETALDRSIAFKELTGSDTTSTISKVPKNSYVWLYLRRTKSRVTKITLTNQNYSVSDTEKAQIDAWLTKNNLTPCGDASGTIYAGGNCLFSESTGVTQDKYELLVKKFPAKPWVATSS